MGLGQRDLAAGSSSFGWSALLLGERFTFVTAAAAAAVLASAALTQRARVRVPAPEMPATRQTLLPSGE